MMSKQHPNQLTVASTRGNLNEVRSLLEQGFPVDSPNKYQHTALQAVPVSCPEIVSILLEYGANPNLKEPVMGGIPLHQAAREGATATLELMLQFGANVNAQDKNGDTPAHLAARKGYLEAFKILNPLADMTIRNHNGDTPLSIADRHPEFRDWINVANVDGQRNT
ncbi:cyclin-dependent kinase 4 inhibitor C-like [Anneissia japonica]|uniref:cyclin-dependent kinase 4 inhibitor C-like n=1 Tax=Anneissia japonica TaxID=1529436 RepID=UPI001425501C|nr:cyclin-dependent kinase 4 inhibitor C-like [Anneissia japonica]